MKWDFGALMEKHIVTLSFLLIVAVAFAYTIVINNNEHSTDILDRRVDNQPACIDSDGGKSFSSAGYVTATNGIQTRIRSDYCKSEKQLIEYYCDGESMKSAEYDCDCKEGVCE